MSNSAKDLNMLSKKKKTFMNFSKAMKPGTFDVKPKEDFAAQTQAISQVFPLPRKSCVSARRLGYSRLVKVTRFQYYPQMSCIIQTVSRISAKLCCERRRHLKFNVCFNPSDPSKLVVSGICEAHVFALSETVEVTNRIAIEGI